MKNGYKHLSHKDRLVIYEHLYNGSSIQDISDMIGCHKTTIYRELHRNSTEIGYKPSKAELAYQHRKLHKPTKLDCDEKLKSLVIEKLQAGWSPELIDGYLRREEDSCVISHETIYRFIYSAEGMKLKLYKHLLCKRKYRYPRLKRRRRSVAKETKKSIHSRSSAIDRRSTYGHWEGDLILFRKTRTNIITLRERKSRFIIGIKNNSRHAQTTADALAGPFLKKSLKTIKSLTLDNGVEFSFHEKMSAKLRAKIYFCDPYKSWQKGAIENANKLIRQTLPRSTNIDDMPQVDIDKNINKLNNRPMKCLDFKTPSEVFMQAFGALPG